MALKVPLFGWLAPTTDGASRRSTLALLGALACASHIPRGLAQTTQTLPVLRVAIISRTVFYAPLWAAQAQHLFRDQGLSVVILVYDNAERITQDLRDGQIDIAIATPESIMVDAYLQGPLRMVAGNAEAASPNHCSAAHSKPKGFERRQVWRLVAQGRYRLFGQTLRCICRFET